MKKEIIDGVKIFSLAALMGIGFMTILYLCVGPFIGYRQTVEVFPWISGPVGFVAVIISIMIIDK
ncbi:hypothetical protein NRS6094_04332 [Bacillus subtilis]|uniref:hypothetical protein n=1 Tax=Bacillus subtilis TaxID=1423 RepID=UPI001B999E34|nr:hypothetical protein [Bacillus subtilis]CAF1778067.1 hypothetical protein NRS6094_04332 [Bacillus subtilis]